MADLWLPGAQRLPLPDTAATDGGPAKAIAHVTWDKNATKAKPQALVSFESLRSYFSGGGAGVAPHILWDPFTGRFAQYYPANSRAKSVADATGGTRTNRAGKVVIQIEALFFPWCSIGGKTYERLVDTPCKGWAELHAWVKSWGVPDAWPMGVPVNFDSDRSESVWEKSAGWYGHSQVPENDHQDPGSWPGFVKEDENDMADITDAQMSTIAKKTADLMVSADYRDALANAFLYWLLRSADPTIALPTGADVPAVVGTTAALRKVLALPGTGGPSAAQLASAAQAGAKAVLAELGTALQQH